jgi:hypothetical protein
VGQLHLRARLRCSRRFPPRVHHAGPSLVLLGLYQFAVLELVFVVDKPVEYLLLLCLFLRRLPAKDAPQVAGSQRWRWAISLHCDGQRAGPVTVCRAGCASAFERDSRERPARRTRISR